MYGSRPPQTARDVAEAFFAGKRRKRGNCETDGRTYWLFGHAIARHVPKSERAELVAKKLRGEKTPTVELQVCWARWPTQTTERHLSAIVSGAYKGRKGHPPTLLGRAVESDKWYTISELEAMPLYEQPARRCRSNHTPCTTQRSLFSSNDSQSMQYA